jgi:acyl-CoA hydrolase
MGRLCTAAQVVGTLRPNTTVYVPGMAGESLSFLRALQASPERAEDVRFVGVHFPSVNRSDYLGIHPRARQRAYFMSPLLRDGIARGRVELLPLDYPGAFRDLQATDIDLAVLQVSPPDERGMCSTGICCDFHPAVWASARRRVLHINPALPRTRSSFSVPFANCDGAFEEQSELVSFDSGIVDDAMMQHAHLVASQIHDGDVLEFGIGKLQAAVLAALRDHRRLRVWSGMASEPILQLLDSGAISGRGSIEIGVALGSSSFYDRVGRDEAFYFRPVSETHDVRQMMDIENFCAINSAVEVDLFGQINADMAGGRLIAGVGGLPAFASAGILAPRGRSIIALPATTADGKASRIVAHLGNESLCAIPRHGADQVITEYGIASLKGLSVHARAEALISISAPQYRDGLAQAWARIAARLVR